MIYLDNASTTKISPTVFEEMEPYLKEEYGNPGSVHELGIKAKKAIDLARERVAKAINALPDEIIFTSGGSEANNLAVKMAVDFWGRSNILSSKLEHDSMKKAIEAYARTSHFLPHMEGEELVRYIDDNFEKYYVNSFMYVNNELGIINPVADICLLNRHAGNLSIIDAVQALGNEDIDVKKIDCDFLSMSSHKIHGPKGVGALYVCKGLDNKYFKPLIWGGERQEYGLRGGTENVAGIVGFGRACKEINIDENKTLISLLRKQLISGLKFDFRENFPREDGKIISLTIPGIDAETLVLMLSAHGVCVSAGSACKSLEQKPNEVLLAAGFTEEEARNTVRISLSCYNTNEEMDEAARIINECVKVLKQ